MENAGTFTAFAGHTRIAKGDVTTMLRHVREHLDDDETAQILIFRDSTGGQVDFDLRGTVDDVMGRLSLHPLFATRDSAAKGTVRHGPGRPKLGVVSREVTLLPRHWEWLDSQQGSASSNLRRLVDEARKGNSGLNRLRAAREAASRVMTSLAGNLANYEEASRALFAGESERFAALIDLWPTDVRDYIIDLASKAHSGAADQ